MDLITIGEVTKPHGFKGEIKVFPLTDDIRRFRKLKYVIIEDVEYKIEFVKLQADRAILKLETVDTEEKAKSLQKKDVKVRKEDAVKRRKGEYFIEDLKKMTVFDAYGLELGKIYDVIQTGSNDVYWIREPKELLIPALKTIIVDILEDENKVIIRPTKEWNYDDKHYKEDNNNIENAIDENMDIKDIEENK